MFGEDDAQAMGKDSAAGFPTRKDWPGWAVVLFLVVFWPVGLYLMLAPYLLATECQAGGNRDNRCSCRIADRAGCRHCDPYPDAGPGRGSG